MRLLLLAVPVAMVFGTSCAQKANGPRSRAPAGAATDSEDGKDDGTDGAALVNYKDDIAPLLKEFKCVSCHASKKKGPDLSTYAKVKASAALVLKSVKAKSMPTTGTKLDDDQIALIQDWIDDGKPETAKKSGSDDTDDDGNDDSDKPKAEVVSYDGWVKGFLATNCISCHGPNNKKPDLSTYELAKLEAERSFDDIKSGDMPKDKADIPSAAQAKFLAWIELDMPKTDADADQGGDPDGGGAALTYDNDIKPLVASHCISCHNTGGQKPILATKAQVQAEADRMYDTSKTTMPKNAAGAYAPMAKADITLLKDWIAAGKK